MKKTQVLNLVCGDTFVHNRQKYIVQSKNIREFGGGAAVVNLQTGKSGGFAGTVYVTPMRLHILTDKQIDNIKAKAIKDHEEKIKFDKIQAERTDW